MLTRERLKEMKAARAAMQLTPNFTLTDELIAHAEATLDIQARLDKEIEYASDAMDKNPPPSRAEIAMHIYPHLLVLNPYPHEKKPSQLAVDMADALIAALNKPTP